MVWSNASWDCARGCKGNWTTRWHCRHCGTARPKFSITAVPPREWPRQAAKKEGKPTTTTTTTATENDKQQGDDKERLEREVRWLLDMGATEDDPLVAKRREQIASIKQPARPRHAQLHEIANKLHKADQGRDKQSKKIEHLRSELAQSEEALAAHEKDLQNLRQQHQQLQLSMEGDSGASSAVSKGQAVLSELMAMAADVALQHQLAAMQEQLAKLTAGMVVVPPAGEQGRGAAAAAAGERRPGEGDDSPAKRARLEQHLVASAGLTPEKAAAAAASWADGGGDARMDDATSQG